MVNGFHIEISKGRPDRSASAPIPVLHTDTLRALHELDLGSTGVATATMT